MRRTVSGPGVYLNDRRDGDSAIPRRGLKRSASLSRLFLTTTFRNNYDHEEDCCDTTSQCSSTSSVSAFPHRRLSQEQLDSIKLPRSFLQEREESPWQSYRLCELLGAGAFGDVFVAVDKITNARRAMKILDKSRMDPTEYRLIRNEVDIQKDLDHPCINRIYDFLEGEEEFCICMDMCSGGDLYAEVAEWGPLSELDAAAIMQQLMSTVKYLHTQQIAHLDINLENILLGSSQHFDQIKLVDFGLAKRFEPGQKLTTICGKLHYIAPQVWKKSYDPAKADVFQCAVAAYTLLAGFAPFDAWSDADIRDVILKGEFNFEDPAWASISDEAKDFCRYLLAYEEAARPTAEETLQHPWVKQSIAASRQTFRRRSSDSAVSSLESMRSFSVTTKLKELLCAFIANQLLEKEEKEDTELLFQLMDQDRKGKLSYQDIQRGYNEFFEEDLSDDALKDLFQRIDLDGSGWIEYSEFVVACSAQSMLSGRRLEACFNLFDKEGSGYISTESLKQNLTGMDNESLDHIIWQVDDGDGKLSFEKFKTIMLRSDG